MPGLAKATLHTLLHDLPQVQQAGTHLFLGSPGSLVGEHQLIQLEAVLTTLGEQLRAGREGIWRFDVRRPDPARFGLVAVNNEAATNRVVVVLAQYARVRRKRGKPHAVGVSRQGFVAHEQKLHGLVEGDFVLAQQFDPTLGAHAPDEGLDAVRIDRFRHGAFESRQDGSIRTVANAGQCQGAVQPHRNLARGREQTVPLQAGDEFPGSAHRAHGVGARWTDADFENVKNAQ
jgi:hypothetical protein